MSLTETGETPPTAKQRMAENQGQSCKHPEQQQTLEARGKNSSKGVKKIQGAWITNNRNRQAKTTRTREGELPPKAGRNQDRTAAVPPSLNKRQRKKTQTKQQKERGDKRPRRQNVAPETPRAPQTGAAGGAKRLRPTTRIARAGEGQAEKQKEDEPRRAVATAPTSQLTRATDSAGQQHIHPKASENKQ